jgi:hypothetical protein
LGPSLVSVENPMKKIYVVSRGRKETRSGIVFSQGNPYSYCGGMVLTEEWLFSANYMERETG